MIDQAIAFAGITGATGRNDVGRNVLATLAKRNHVVLRQAFKWLAAVGATVVIRRLNHLPFLAGQGRFDSELSGAGALAAQLTLQSYLLWVRGIPCGPMRLDFFGMTKAKFSLLGGEVIAVCFAIASLRFNSAQRFLSALVGRTINLTVPLAPIAFFRCDFRAMRLDPCGHVTGLAQTLGFDGTRGMALSCATQYGK